MDNTDKITLLMLSMACLIVLIFASGAAMEYYQEQTVVGEIVVVKQGTWPWKHTTIEIKTYSGNSITVTFEGHYMFNIGDITLIKTRGTWYRQAYPSLIEFSVVTGESIE